MISQTKPLKIIYFLQFNFAITKIFVGKRLAEDGTRMGGTLFQVFPGKNLVLTYISKEKYASKEVLS